MKTSICFLCIITLAFSSLFAIPTHQEIHNANVNIKSHSAQSIELDFDCNSVNREFLSLDFKDNSGQLSQPEMIYETGKPILPLISRFVIVPPDKNVRLEVNSSSRRIEGGLEAPVLCQNQKIDPDPYFQPSGIFPAQIAEISNPLVIRGIRLVKVTTYPVQYDFTNEHYIFNDHIEVELHYGNDQPINPVRVPNRKNRSPQFTRFIKALAINGDQLLRDEADQFPEYLGHYLVVIHENAVEHTAPFIEWKRRSGYKVDIISVPSNIAAVSPDGTKELIQDKYDEYLDRGIDPFDHLLLVGDLHIYTWPPAPGWVLKSYGGESLWPGHNHADYKFALLEGGEDDMYPDVAFSRWCAGTNDFIDLNVQKTFNYEAEPFMDNPDWFTRGAVYSQHWGNDPDLAWHPTIHTNVRWAREILVYRGFDNIQFYENYDYDQYGAEVGPFVREQFNAGTNLLLGRAENLTWVQNFHGVNNTDVNPIRLVLSGHGEYTTWQMMRTGDGENTLGPVAATCGWGGPPTISTSAVWLELVGGVLQRGLTLGWSRVYSTIICENYFPEFRINGHSVYLHIKTDTDMYGDPGLKPWTAAPERLTVSHPQNISASPGVVTIRVMNSEDDPVSGASVCLYAPGNLPDFGSNAYIDYDGMENWLRLTDASGYARFAFNGDRNFQNGQTILLTVRGENLYPYQASLTVGPAPFVVEAVDFTFEETTGNGDGEINPGEAFNLTFSAVNNGQAAVQNLDAIVRSSNEYMMIEGANQLQFGNLNPGQEVEANQSVTIMLANHCPDGESRPVTRPVLQVDFRSGDSELTTGFELSPKAPDWELAEPLNILDFSADAQELNLSLTNTGQINAPAITARLHMADAGINIGNNQASFPSINTGEASEAEGDPLSISIDPAVAVPGAVIPVYLILQENEVVRDTAAFSIQLGEVQEDSPLGPDEFGYIAYDNSDVDWNNALEYDWVEINPNDQEYDFEGTIIEDFTGRSQYDIGENITVALPFQFGFYGELYDTISVCTNGFICPGDQSSITNYQNWQLDRGTGGGAGMIAPFWDWLNMIEQSDICYYVDENEGFAIIEWYNFRQRPAGESNLTFQVKLFDASKWSDENGCTDILFQYKTITNEEGANEPDSNMPFASVGISSPDGSTGINCSFMGEQPVNSAPLSNRRAILFKSSQRLHDGLIYGSVVEAQTGDPVSDVNISLDYGLMTSTGDGGRYELNNIVRNYEFRIIARHEDYDEVISEPVGLYESSVMEYSIRLTGVDVDEQEAAPPEMFLIDAIHPNPFNSTTTISYSLRTPRDITLSIYNTRGQLVDVLIDRAMPAGSHSVVWDADETPAGVYLARMNEQVRKVVLVK